LSPSRITIWSSALTITGYQASSIKHQTSSIKRQTSSIKVWTLDSEHPSRITYGNHIFQPGDHTMVMARIRLEHATMSFADLKPEFNGREPED